MSLEHIAGEYGRYACEGHTLLHLDHVPVIDEDLMEVDYVSVISRAIAAGYQSVMVDASRLDLEGNIAATRRVADMVHAAGIPVEAELGTVMGHESKAMIPCEEIFEKKIGFSDAEEAKLDIERIASLRDALNIPLVLHGGSGIENEYITRAIASGIAKINVAIEIRQPYERALREKNDAEYARECCV